MTHQAAGTKPEGERTSARILARKCFTDNGGPAYTPHTGRYRVFKRVRDAWEGRPLFVSEVALTDPLVAGRVALPWASGTLAGYLRSSGERGLVVENQHVLVVRQSSSKRVVLFLEPHKLGFQVANTLLEAAHFRDHAGIGTADVAE